MYVIRSKDGNIVSAFASKQDENDYPGQEEISHDDPDLIDFISKMSSYDNSNQE